MTKGTKRMTASEFDKIKMLTGLISIKLASKVSGRSQATVWTIKQSKDLTSYHEYNKNKAITQKSKIATSKEPTTIATSDKVERLDGDKAIISSLNGIVALLRAIEYDLQKLLLK